MAERSTAAVDVAGTGGETDGDERTPPTETTATTPAGHRESTPTRTTTSRPGTAAPGRSTERTTEHTDAERTDADGAAPDDTGADSGDSAGSADSGGGAAGSPTATAGTRTTETAGTGTPGTEARTTETRTADARTATDTETGTDPAPPGDAAETAVIPPTSTTPPRTDDTDTRTTTKATRATTKASPKASAKAGATGATAAPDLHSGHKLARRYRLEECTTRLDGFSSWRAVDEKLRRAVGVHLLPAGHSRARAVLAAARSAALLADPRFVQVLDAVEEGELVYIVHEWLPDAAPLTEHLASGPLVPYEAYQLVKQVSQAMAAAHREGLAHLRLTPGAVLRTGQGQYRIRGLAVNAALRGITADEPERTDTEAIGALLYASLTQRWPYEEDAYGLSGVAGLSGGDLVPPDQVRAGVHRALSEVAMRALVNNGATAASQDQPCTTPQELVAAVATLPRIKPPEPDYPDGYPHPGYRPAGYRSTGYGGYPPKTARTAAARANPPAEPVPTLPGRTGKVLKWGVSALLIAALGLGSWQVADALMNGGDSGSSAEQKEPDGAAGEGTPPTKAETGKPVRIVSAKDFDPQGRDGGQESPSTVPRAIDGDPSTFWNTSFYASAKFGNLKDGVGLILDLGKPQQVSTVKVNFKGATAVDFLAAPQTTTSRPDSLSAFSKVTGGRGESVVLTAEKPIRSQYLLVWLTELPLTEAGEYRGRVTGIEVSS